MSLFYHIRPKNNGTIKLGITKQGEYIEIPKGIPNHDDEILLFKDEKEAENYIKSYLNDNYIVEWTWKRNEFICPSCGSNLKVQIVVEAKETQSGCTERLCSCCNKHCSMDWNLVTDKNDSIIKIERYFFG